MAGAKSSDGPMLFLRVIRIRTPGPPCYVRYLELNRRSTRLRPVKCLSQSMSRYGISGAAQALQPGAVLACKHVRSPGETSCTKDPVSARDAIPGSQSTLPQQFSNRHTALRLAQPEVVPLDKIVCTNDANNSSGDSDACLNTLVPGKRLASSDAYLNRMPCRTPETEGSYSVAVVRRGVPSNACSTSAVSPTVSPSLIASSTVKVAQSDSSHASAAFLASGSKPQGARQEGSDRQTGSTPPDAWRTGSTPHGPQCRAEGVLGKEAERKMWLATSRLSKNLQRVVAQGGAAVVNIPRSVKVGRVTVRSWPDIATR